MTVKAKKQAVAGKKGRELLDPLESDVAEEGVVEDEAAEEDEEVGDYEDGEEYEDEEEELEDEGEEEEDTGEEVDGEDNVPEYAGDDAKGGLAVVGDPDEIDGCHFEEERKKILELRDKAGDANWDLAIALQAAYKDALYESWNFTSWKQYVEEEVQINIRKAQQLVQIQEWCDLMPTNIQKWIRSLGYAKARELVRVVTVDNIERWKNLVDGKSLAEITKLLKGLREDGETEETEGLVPKEKDNSSPMNFRLFPEQKTLVDAAIKKGMGMAGSDKKSHALDLICTEFMAANAGVDNVPGYLRNIERSNGLRLVAYDIAKDEIIHGFDLLKEFEALDKEDLDEEEVEEEESSEA